MAGRIEGYRAELRKLKNWEPYLTKHSGLPGPRAKLELLAAEVEDGDPEQFWKLSNSTDEFIAACGAAGLGRIALTDSPLPLGGRAGKRDVGDEKQSQQIAHGIHQGALVEKIKVRSTSLYRLLSS